MTVGNARVVADGVLQGAGVAVEIFGMHIISGGTAGVVKLRDGSAVSGNILIQENGTISTGKSINYGGNGVQFPNGCYVDIDANVVSVNIFYQAL